MYSFHANFLLSILSRVYDCVNYSLLAESVKALLGKHVKILLKNVVKLETKQDKQENRVLVSNLFFCVHIFLSLSFSFHDSLSDILRQAKLIFFSTQGVFAMSPLSLIGQSTHKSKSSVFVFFLVLLCTRNMAFIFLFFYRSTAIFIT